MKNPSKALDLAVRVANLLKEGGRYLSANIPIQQYDLMTDLSVMRAVDKLRSLDPNIEEIILFGSAAKDGTEPRDLDLMVFDQGFYSNVFLADINNQKYGEGNSVETNFLNLLTTWFGYHEDTPKIHDILKETDIDLLVLPLAVFTNKMKRQEIADRQYDPEFFQNAFSSMMRFDDETGQFVKIDLSYFELKYRVDLSELWKPVEMTA